MIAARFVGSTTLALALAVAIVVGAVGCADDGRDQAEATDCAEARLVLAACGISAPYLERDDCVGPLSLVAGCIVDHGQTCESLAELAIDDCLEELDLAGAVAPGGSGEGGP